MSNAASTPEFKKILESLYSSGQYTTSGEVLREAWREYKERHGELGRSGSVQRKRYAMRRTAEWMNPRRKKLTRKERSIEFLKKRDFPHGVPKWLLKKYPEAFFSKENPRKKKSRKSCSSCGGLMSGDVCLTCISTKNPRRKQRRNPVSWQGVKRCYVCGSKQNLKRDNRGRVVCERHATESLKSGKNPIAVYNPPKHRGVKLPATNIEIRYRRSSGRYAGKHFSHHFKSGASLWGMPDGSVMIKSSTGKKLWGTVD